MRFFKLLINKDMYDDENKKRGLTLVETLVAISILTIAVVGPLGIIAQALHTSYYIRDQMTAYYLAQEAIEYVRNIRDDQSIAITKSFLDNPDTPVDSTAWFNNVLFIDGNNNKPQISPYIGNIYSYSLVKSSTYGTYSFVDYNTPDYMKVKDGIYGTDALDGVPSQFKREIYFQRTNNTPGSDQAFVMVVNVYWKNGSTPAKLTLKEYFTNWASKTGL